ncbi:transposase, partial [Candidatus Saccharibacteria bacterium]|nr:transposase [Candidatus Saccharibacteria bacterium]
GILKSMLEYKCRWADVVFGEVNEAYTTQTCSCCRSISSNSPKGRADLGIRSWTCVVCGTHHDRDINAGINIAKRGESQFLVGAGHCPPVVGIPVL